MTRQEHLEILHGRLRRARAHGDRLEANEISLEIYELEKVKDTEYDTYIRVSKMYAENSVMSGIRTEKINI
jgi:hypothetical protein